MTDNDSNCNSDDNDNNTDNYCDNDCDNHITMRMMIMIISSIFARPS